MRALTGLLFCLMLVVASASSHKNHAKGSSKLKKLLKVPNKDAAAVIPTTCTNSGKEGTCGQGFWQCSHNSWYQQNCRKTCKKCEPTALKVRLSRPSGSTAGPHVGKVLIAPQMPYQSHSFGVICDRAWDLNSADVICVDLEYGKALRAPTGSKYGDYHVRWLSEAACIGRESKFEMCQHSVLGNWECQMGGGNTASVECSPDPNYRPARSLVGGLTSWEGRVLVRTQNLKYGWVCESDDIKTMSDVACKELGFPNGALDSQAKFGSYRDKQYPTFLKDLQCGGDEDSLWACPGAPNKQSQGYEVQCSRKLSVRCDIWSKPDITDWEICPDSFCDCDNEARTVSCPQDIHRYALGNLEKFIPSDAKELKFVKTRLGNFHEIANAEPLYKALSKCNNSLEKLEIEFKEYNLKCYFKYDARKFLDIFNPHPSQMIVPRPEGWTAPQFLFTDQKQSHCFRRPQDTDVCKGDRCYVLCGRSKYTDDDEAVFRALEFESQVIHAFYQDLADLEVYASEVSTSISLYAQNVYLNSVFTMPKKNLTIITRHFEVGNDAAFEYNGNRLRTCKQAVYLKEQRYYLVLSGGGANVYVWAETMKLNWNVGFCEADQDNVPALKRADEYHIGSSILCAKQLYRTNIAENKNIVKTMLKYVSSETAPQISKDKDSYKFYSYLYNTAGEFIELIEQSATDQNSLRFVPFLSQDTYSKASQTWSDILKTNNGQFEGTITQSSALVSARSSATNCKDQYENALDQVKISEKTLVLARKEYNTAKTNFQKAQKTFQDGIETAKKKATEQAVFGVFKNVVGLITGVVSSGGVSVQSVMSTISGIEDLIRSLVAIEKMIKSFKSWDANFEAILNTVKEPKTVDPKDFEDRVKFVNDVASLTVSMGSWDKMEQTASKKLEDAQQILGFRGFQIAILQLVTYGKMITKETIRQAKVMRKAMLLKSNAESAELISGMLQSTLDWTDANKVKEWSRLQAFRNKFTVNEVIEAFCEAYFYDKFSECDPATYVDPSNSLLDVSNSLKTQRLENLMSVGSFCGPPQTLNTDLILDEAETLESLKTTKSFEIKEDAISGRYIGYDRVRLERIEVWIEGATSPSGADDQIYMDIVQSGVSKDIYRGVTYGFTSEKPYKVAFSYKILSKEIALEPEIHKDSADMFSEPTPRSRWIVSLPQDREQNAVIDFSQVKQIKIKLSGSVIPACRN